MTKKELFERHNTMCKYCDKADCDGIHLTIKNTTVCEKGEMKEPILHCEIDITAELEEEVELKKEKLNV